MAGPMTREDLIELFHRLRGDKWNDPCESCFMRPCLDNCKLHLALLWLEDETNAADYDLRPTRAIWRGWLLK